MEFNRRRTDRLAQAAELPGSALERSRAACDELVRLGMQSAAVLLVTDQELAPPMLVAGAGRVGSVADMGRALADRVERERKALIVVEPEAANLDSSVTQLRPTERYAAVHLGTHRDGTLVLVVSDPVLSRREAEALAVWVAVPEPARAFGGMCGELAHSAAVQFDADVVATAVFVQSSMLVTLHARSGALLRAWRTPADTLWGEAARHNAAFVLGDLRRHPGAEALASLGMQHAAVVGLENGDGVAVGALGVAKREHLHLDVAEQLISLAPAYGAELIRARTAPLESVRGAEAVVELTTLASRVGCARFSVYARSGNGLALISAHRADGSLADAYPDHLEEQLICWAAEQGGAVAIEQAAAVLVGGDTVLYARDPHKQPMACLRNALLSLRDDGEQRRAA